MVQHSIIDALVVEALRTLRKSLKQRGACVPHHWNMACNWVEPCLSGHDVTLRDMLHDCPWLYFVLDIGHELSPTTMQQKTWLHPDPPWCIHELVDRWIDGSVYRLIGWLIDWLCFCLQSRLWNGMTCMTLPQLLLICMYFLFRVVCLFYMQNRHSSLSFIVVL
jgi:hypothetical protein